MKTLLVSIGLLLSSNVFAQTSAELCLIKVSPCRVSSSVDESEQVLSQYNGVTNEVMEYQATASFAYTYRDGATNRWHHHSVSSDSAGFQRGSFVSSWSTSIATASTEALRLCEDSREEISESMAVCR